MKKKWILLCALAMAAVMALAGCGGSDTGTPSDSTQTRETAGAALTEGGKTANVTVDLSGGWSVEFASGAFYLYDSVPDKNTEAKAIGMTLEDKVYEEYLGEAKASDTFKEEDGVISYAQGDGSTAYLFTAGQVCLMLTVNKDEDGAAVFARITAEPAEGSESESENVSADGAEYGYDGDDPVELAVWKYMAEVVSKDYEKADASIPVVQIISKDDSKTDDILVKGVYWIYNYNIEDDTLMCVSGGEYPGCMHVKQNDDGTCEVTSFDVVEDGSNYDSSAREIFGDDYDKFIATSDDEETRNDLRKHAVEVCVDANDLSVTQYQDEGWPVVELNLEDSDDTDDTDDTDDSTDE